MRRARRTRRTRRRWLIPLIIVALVVVASAAMLIIYNISRVTITIKAEDTQMDEGGEIPKVPVEVSVSGNEKGILGLSGGRSAADLIKEFEDGEGYTAACEEDTGYEGTYPIKITLTQETDKELNSGINGLLHYVKVQTEDGEIEVKNPVGYWDGDKFKTYDGDYVKKDFVTSNKKTYYFNKKGEKVTGFKTIKDVGYYFDEDGVMQTNTWETADDATYYFGEDGKALTGWQDLDGDTYYFLEDGKMVTGRRFVDSYHCLFGEDGKLESKEEAAYDPDQPMVALTFDDGPGPRTMEILDQLEAYDARATFFVLGELVDSYPEALEKELEIGCEIGNHTYDHKQLTSMSADSIKKEVEDTNKKIKNITGETPTLVRPPYGAVNETVRSTIKAPLIIWNIDTLDWQTRNTEKDISAVMDTLEDGNIILMHDIHTETVDAALQLIPMIQDAGYQLVTVSELAEAKDVTLEDGEKYFNF